MMFTQKSSWFLVVFSSFFLFSVYTDVSAGLIKGLKHAGAALRRKATGKKEGGLAKKILDADHTTSSNWHTEKIDTAIAQRVAARNVTRGINGDGQGSSPLHAALKVNCPFCTLALLSADGINITQADPTQGGASPLQVGVRYGSFEAVFAMLRTQKDALSALLGATDDEGRSFVHELGRLPRKKLDRLDRALSIETRGVKNSFDANDITIFKNRVEILQQLILEFGPEVVQVSYQKKVPHTMLHDDEFPEIDNRQEGESSVLPIRLSFILRRAQDLLVQERSNKKGMLGKNVVLLIAEIEKMKIMADNPASVMRESERRKSARMSMAGEALAFHIPEQYRNRVGSVASPSPKAVSTGTETLLMHDNKLTRDQLEAYRLASTNRDFLMDHYRAQVTQRCAHEFYNRAVGQSADNRRDAQLALSGNWQVRLDTTDRLVKTLLKFVPFIGSGASAVANQRARDVKLRSLVENNRGLLKMAANDTIFDQVIEQVILRVIARYPEAFTPNATYDTLPEIFKLDDITERAQRGVETSELENLVLLRINKVLFNLRDNLARQALPQAKVEMILTQLLGDHYEPLDTTALGSQDTHRPATTSTLTAAEYEALVANGGEGSSTGSDDNASTASSTGSPTPLPPRPAGPSPVGPPVLPPRPSLPPRPPKPVRQSTSQPATAAGQAPSTSVQMSDAEFQQFLQFQQFQQMLKAQKAAEQFGSNDAGIPLPPPGLTPAGCSNPPPPPHDGYAALAEGQ